jgi:NTE family protein
VNSPVWKPRIALALSGGGFRASVFHLGVLRRVAELGWLSQVDMISTVSGGSILGAFIALRWSEIENSGADVFDRCIVRPFIDLVSSRDFIREWALRLPAVLPRKMFDRTYTRTSLAAELLGQWFFESKNCADLPARPYLVLNATTLITMRSWRFTRDGMGDSRIGHAAWNGRPLPLGVCVGASAAFPPVFPPARLDARSYEFSGPVYGEPPVESHPFIAVTDGGVYDNLGVEVAIKPVVEVAIKPVKVPGRDDKLHPPSFLLSVMPELLRRTGSDPAAFPDGPRHCCCTALTRLLASRYLHNGGASSSPTLQIRVRLAKACW